MADPVNPFSLVFDSLWTLAERHPVIADLAANNKIRFNDADDRDPDKDNILTADLPELALTSEGMSANLQSTSSSSQCTRNFTWWITTGDHRINRYLHPVEWALWCAMCGWKDTVAALQWEGRSFVKRVNLTTVTHAKADQRRSKSIAGWVASWSLEVEMHFETSVLLGELED